MTVTIAVETTGQEWFGAVHKVRHAIFGQFLPPAPVTLCHTFRAPNSTSHISEPRTIFSRPSTKSPDKSPLYKFSLNCSRVVVVRGFVFYLEGFVRGAFCPFPLLSECMCYNRKLNFT